MEIPFTKYQGAGNDFIMIDCRQKSYLDVSDSARVVRMCNRRFGIGADGLILLKNHPDYDFEMTYFNADGREGSMCGNGGRCIAAFAKALGLIQNECLFLAVDGLHRALIQDNGWVELQMQNVDTLEIGPDDTFLDTGSPHLVKFVDKVSEIDIHSEGKKIRESARFAPGGTNVNFVQAWDDFLFVATFERGVEEETLACGTGVTAAALVHHVRSLATPGTYSQPISTKGADLEVRFTYTASGTFEDIWLCGPAVRVFEGRFVSVV
ncbi:MAG: diaminopimelate epimerase [Saprospiraceae bacterium]|nr:diaminopimelate epimerase [Saprospiraceae bacterium]